MEEDEADRRVRSGFEELCRDLNVDEEASSDAWSRFQCISNTFTLEGSELHWLACSLYSSCRSSGPPVGKGTSEGNYVSLTRILRCANMSVMEFFRKMKKWQDMADLPLDFRRSTDRLERNFTVSAVIFQKFVPIFRSVFKTPSEEPPRVHRGRKQRRHPCTVSEVFNFCWLLFVLAKGNFPLVGDDLVNSFHLLLCAVDLVFTNALLSHARKDLVNPDFSGLPADFSSQDFRPPGSLCVLQPLCEQHDGLMLEAKGVKQHFWKPLIRRLFHRRILRGKEDSLTGVLDPINFGDSFLSLSRLYEDHILASGGLDERIFTGEGASEDIGTPGVYLCEGPPPAPTTLKASCPAAGRRCLPGLSPASPLWTALRSVGHLHTLLSGSKQGASARLEETLRKCSRDPSAAMDRRLSAMLDLLTQHYEGGPAEIRGLMSKDVAVRYFHLAVALYYRTLESIIEREKTILGDADLSVLLEQDVFHRSLLVCCFQVVAFSFRPPGDFPNVLATFRLPAFHFYKVIEVLVRSEQRLFREVVKHLNQVEEQVLESLAWTSDSPLWESLRGVQDRAPPCQEVIPPQYLEQSDPGGCDLKGVPPPPASLLDRYSSPPTSSSARRRLFADPPDGGVVSGAVTKTTQPTIVTAIPAGQTVVTMATATVTANNGQTVTIPVQGIANESGGITFIPVQVSVTGQAAAAMKPPAAQTLTGTIVQPAASKPVAKATGSPLRKGSVSLFFRKVYHLASVRVRSLCAALDLGSELSRKVWTCLEFSLVNFPLMMKDRHLDQLILCAVYVMAKVTKEELSFQNIMRCYRCQPQACSDVYRSVLISNGRSLSDSSVTCSNAQDAAGGDVSAAPLHPSSTFSTPIKHSSSSCLPAGGGEERGDLIHFYNKVYIKQMRQFALRFSPSSPSAGAPPLCPFPTLRTGSPRRMLLSNKHPIYISPHKAGSAPSATTPRDKIHYYVCSSPPTRLQEINLLLSGQTPSRKRFLSLDEDSPVKRVCPENHCTLLRRLQDVANDRSSSH